MTYLLLLLVCVGVSLGGPVAAQVDSLPMTAAVIRPVPLMGAQGTKAGPCLSDLRFCLFWPKRTGGFGSYGRLGAGLPLKKAACPKTLFCLLPGGPAIHQKRIALLKKANLEKKLADRLLAGRIKAGDFFNYVEMAWGKPQRSFMVNYFQDEQHYVYFRPGGDKVLLRFKNGRLVNPVKKK